MNRTPARMTNLEVAAIVEQWHRPPGVELCVTLQGPDDPVALSMSLIGDGRFAVAELDAGRHSIKRTFRAIRWLLAELDGQAPQLHTSEILGMRMPGRKEGGAA